MAKNGTNSTQIQLKNISPRPSQQIKTSRHCLIEDAENGKSKTNITTTMDESQTQNSDPVESIIGEVGRWQIVICLAIALLKVPIAFHQLGIIFLAPPAPYKCVEPQEATNGVCLANCTKYEYNTTVFQNTIVMQWDLVCSKEWMKNMTQMIFMFGVLLGNMIFGFFADRYGRRWPLLLAVLVQVVMGVASSFASDWYTFTIIRFVLAMSTGGTMITSFVLTMEMVGVKYRQLFSMAYHIPFNIGHAIMVGIAYLTSDSWSSFQLWISIPTIFFLAYYWLIPESPRWLLVMGKTNEAIEVLKRGAEVNGIPTEHIASRVEEYQKGEKNEKEKSKETIVGLLKTTNMRRKTLFLCFGWLSCGICFFGVSQYVGQLVGNIYINVLISALIQIPGTIAVIYLNNYFGRKKTLIGAYFLSGLPLVGISLIPEAWKTIRVAFALIGILGMSLSFPTIYLFSGEIFPTVLRNTGMGLCSMLARCGSMIAPFIAGLDTFNYWMPPLVLGGMPLLAAIFTIFLPETHGKVLPNTLEEAESFGKANKSSMKNGNKTTD